VEPLKNGEKLIGMLRIKTSAVVAYKINGFAILLLGTYFYGSILLAVRVLECV